jgi:aspartate/methionine/tyrosine aminotransferase
VPRTRSDEEWAIALLEEEGVLVHPGYLFDLPSEGWLVLNLIAPEDGFRTTARRTLEYVRRTAGAERPAPRGA